MSIVNMIGLKTATIAKKDKSNLKKSHVHITNQSINKALLIASSQDLNNNINLNRLLEIKIKLIKNLRKGGKSPGKITS